MVTVSVQKFPCGVSLQADVSRCSPLKASDGRGKLQKLGLIYINQLLLGR